MKQVKHPRPSQALTSSLPPSSIAPRCQCLDVCLCLHQDTQASLRTSGRRRHLSRYVPSLVCYLFAQFFMKLSTSNCAGQIVPTNGQEERGVQMVGARYLLPMLLDEKRQGLNEVVVQAVALLSALTKGFTMHLIL